MSVRVKFVLVLLSLSLTQIPSFATSDFGVEMLGRAPLNGWGAANDLATRDNFLYVACGQAGLRILDISDPDTLIETGFYDLLVKNALEVEVGNEYAYVLDEAGAIHVLDVRDPEATAHVKSIPAATSGAHIKIYAGNLYYSRDTNAGLVTYSLANPANPRILSTFPDVPVECFDIADDKVYINQNGENITIIDIADPERPRQIVRYLNHDEINAYTSMVVAGNLIFTNTGQIFDVTNPAQPVVRGQAALNGEVGCVGVWDEFFMAVGSNFSLVDATFPEAPTVLFEVQLPRDSNGFEAIGDRAFVGITNGTNKGIQPFELTNNFELVRRTQYRSQQGVSYAVVDDNLAIIPAMFGRTSGFEVYDISNPAGVELLGTYRESATTPMAVDGDRMLAIVGNREIGWISLSDPAEPSLIGRFALPDEISPNQIAFQGAFAYLTGNNGRLYIALAEQLDRVPEVIGSCELGGSARKIVLSGDRAFVRMESTVAIVDISNPDSPSLLGVKNLTQLSDIAVCDGNLLIVSEESRLNVYDYSDPLNLELMGGIDRTGSDRKMHGSGNHFWLYDGVVNIISVADPFHPRQVGYMDTPGSPYMLDVQGSRAFIAGGTNFGIYDCADALSDSLRLPPWETGEDYGIEYGTSILNAWTETCDIACSGSTMLVATGNSGLQIFDVSDPASPAFIRQYETGSNVEVMALDGDFAIIGSGNGVKFLDVGNPAEPLLIDSGESEPTAIDVSGDLVVLGGYYIYLYDISDRRNPILLSRIEEEEIEMIAGIEIVDDFLFCLTMFDQPKLMIYNIANLAEPAFINQIIHGENDYGRAMESHGDFLYAAFYDRILIYDIREPEGPNLVRVIENEGDQATIFDDIAIVGEYLYVGSMAMGIDIYDLSSAPDIELLESTNAMAMKLSVSGETVYALQEGGEDYEHVLHAPGVEVIRYDADEGLVEIGDYYTSNGIRDVKVMGDHTFAELEEGTIVSIDIGNPDRPREVSRYDLEEAQWTSIKVSDGTIIGIDDRDIRFIDASDPDNLRLISSYHTNSPMTDLMKRDTILYVATAPLTILNISDLENPTLVGRVIGINYPGQFAMDDEYLYVLDGRVLTILDLDNPAAPQIFSQSPAIDCDHLEVYGDHLFAAYTDYPPGPAGIRIYNLARREAPALQMVIPHSGRRVGFDITDEGVLAISSDSRGVKLFDISRFDEEGPVEIGSFRTPGEATGVAFWGEDRLIVADGSSLGFYRWEFPPNEAAGEFEQPTEFTFGLYPNPANSVITVEYSLPRAGSVRLRLYDLQGRLVSDVMEVEYRTAGLHRSHFGTGSLASGLYYLTLEANGRKFVRKAVVLK